ncbi:MAG: hypothetical protein KF708_09215 [Pirellulales bacterium]|nr:hypothetical protein [Pirellulales bacterium]
MSRRESYRRIHPWPRAVAIPRGVHREWRRLAIMVVAGAVAYAVALLACGMAAGDDGPPELPTFKQVEKLVQDRFGTHDHEMTDLITREQTDELFAEIAKRGWKIRDGKEILERVPRESEFFVRQLLGSKQGRAFMRDVAPMPLGYDRVDRLSHLERGHRFVKDMIKGPDGYKLIEYLTETRYGKNMGRQLRDAPDGAGFNKPTGRIYTADQLLPVLRDHYDAEKRLRAATASNAP